MIRFLKEIKEIENELMSIGIFIESVNFNVPDFATKF